MMLITFGIHLYEICTNNVFLISLVYFQKCAAIKKKVTMVSKHNLVPRLCLLRKTNNIARIIGTKF